MSCIAKRMKFHLLKWLGTFVIIVTGFLVAVKLTIKGKVYEQQFYNVIVEDYNFDAPNSKHVEASFVLGFKNKKTAKFYLSKKHDILELIRRAFLEKVSDINDLTEVKATVFKVLNEANYPVFYVYFNKEPKIF